MNLFSYLLRWPLLYSLNYSLKYSTKVQLRWREVPLKCLLEYTIYYNIFQSKCQGISLVIITLLRILRSPLVARRVLSSLR
jgi:hypothetical protein